MSPFSVTTMVSPFSVTTIVSPLTSFLTITVSTIVSPLTSFSTITVSTIVSPFSVTKTVSTSIEQSVNPKSHCIESDVPINAPTPATIAIMTDAMISWDLLIEVGLILVAGAEDSVERMSVSDRPTTTGSLTS